MNSAFKSMSDLIADSEDLLARISRSEIPQVRALADTFRLAVEKMSEQLRTRAKRLRMGADIPRNDDITANDDITRDSEVTRNGSEVGWLYVTVAASLAIGVLAFMRILGKISRDNAVE